MKEILTFHRKMLDAFEQAGGTPHPWDRRTVPAVEYANCDPDCKQRATCANAGAVGHTSCGVLPCGCPVHHRPCIHERPDLYTLTAKAKEK